MEELKRKGISCLTLAESDPKGKARRQETMAYFRAMNEGMDPEIRAKTVESAKPSKEFGQRFMKEFFSVNGSAVPAEVSEIGLESQEEYEDYQRQCVGSQWF